MATLPPPRCSCGRYLRRRAEGHDDYQEQERSYWHESEECPCGGDVRAIGAAGPEPTRVARRERPRTTASKQRARMHKHTCACQPPRLLRAATRDLTDLECPRCSSYFVWQPTDSELREEELAGRQSA